MTIVVKVNPNTTDRNRKWIVKQGTGRGAGGRVLSRHRLKRAAMRSARRQAKTGEQILVQNEQTGMLSGIRGGL